MGVTEPAKIKISNRLGSSAKALKTWLFKEAEVHTRKKSIQGSGHPILKC
jgi:hypothetical protein